MDDVLPLVIVMLIVLLYGHGCWRVGGYYRRRGRSFRAGFVLAFVFTPVLAWIFGMVLPANAEAQAEQRLAAGTLKKCPACAELVKAEATKCRHCSEPLPT